MLSRTLHQFQIIPDEELQLSSSAAQVKGQRRMSKIKTLQSAIAYIHSLEDMLGEEEEEEEAKKPSFEKCLQL